MAADPDPSPDPSRHSHYVGDRFYRELIDAFAGWQTDAAEARDAALRESCRRLLEREARLLDQGLFDDWLDMYAPECVYWVPAAPDGGDPRREVAVAFDDRRRLEDRVHRLRSAYAWSQQPASRTSRMVANATVFATAQEDVFMLRSNFLIAELREDDLRTHAGWCGHRVRRRGENWEILVKQVNLIDCDRNLRNPAILL